MRTDRELRRPSEREATPDPAPPRRREGELFVAVATWLERNPETLQWNETSARAQSRSRDGLPDCERELRSKYADRRAFRIVLHVEDLSTGRTREIRDAPAVSNARGRELAAQLRAGLRGDPPPDPPVDELIDLTDDDGEPF